MCRQSDVGPESKTYYFEGCWTIFMEKIDENIKIVVGVTIGVVVLMVNTYLYVNYANLSHYSVSTGL